MTHVVPPPHLTDVDVIVVGAGPGGSAAALTLARLGVDSVLLLDRAQFPRPKTCGSGISPRTRRALDRLSPDLWPQIAPRAYPIKALKLVAPSGQAAMFGGPYSAAVLNRRDLDNTLAQAAVRQGVLFRDGVRVRALLTRAERVVGVSTEELGDVTARFVVVANGAKSALVHLDPRPKRTLQTCVAWFEGMAHPKHAIEMVFDPKVLPHYAWLFPETEARVNIGVCIDQDRLQGSIRDLFQDLLTRHWGDRLRDAKQVGDWRGHPIVCTDTIAHHAPPGALLVGEANRLVNIATGEGVSYAIESGIEAAHVLYDALALGLDDAEVSRRYLAAIQGRLAWGLRGGEWFRRYGVRYLEGAVRLGQSAAARWVGGLLDQPAPPWEVAP